MLDTLCARVTDLNGQLKQAQVNSQALVKHLLKYGLIVETEKGLNLLEKSEWLEKPKKAKDGKG